MKKMKNDQLEIASNCEEKEGYICQDAQDPFDIDEYTETHTIQVRQRRTKVKKIKAPKGLENILYNIYEEINDIKNTVYKFESGYNAGFYIWKYGKYYIATRPYENGKYISYLLYFEPFEVERPENYRFYINGNASTAAIIELAAIKTLIHKNFACCNWKKEVVNNFGIAYHRKSKEAQK